MTERLGARELLDRVRDPGSWTSRDAEAHEPATRLERYDRPG